ncbi:MAG: DUF4167 domain-containing protein [Exiguobacterium profundum]|nr:MAG: DUF4167 domain-containing protein [Exiguobacterium profundum]
MRSSKSRSRSKANRPRTLGNIINRVFDSSGPEGKVRGTPQQIIEKYLFLARDAQLSNDRVAAENFLQHAEHYTRLLGEAQRELAAEQEARQQQFQQNGQNRDGNRDQNRDGNRDGRGDQNRDGNGNRDSYRDRREGEFRSDRGEGRFDQGRGDYGAPEVIEIASGAEVIDLSGDDDAGLVETPETLALPLRPPLQTVWRNRWRKRLPSPPRKARPRPAWRAGAEGSSCRGRCPGRGKGRPGPAPPARPAQAQGRSGQGRDAD